MALPKQICASQTPVIRAWEGLITLPLPGFSLVSSLSHEKHVFILRLYRQTDSGTEGVKTGGGGEGGGDGGEGEGTEGLICSFAEQQLITIAEQMRT
eukprot:CAMPEP_0201534700 /NCGR_PEP_ID=MMETSP0161_2-20130828/57013_1 /ASSEMBLY_ACC=CAM_ASM_000251 /TAXON_ID=180227 /ORGANISM="Neoparamoeba aestuarina, Strain SoJaBio B1-5/56/2" /LENGTH=96 /DNA_ID=CAMNT_0047939479 /DNA_START=70 /DNA_END=356 /DNA_ORIENTATION=+